MTDAHVDDADPDDVASNDSRRSVEPLKVPNMSYNTFMTHCQELAAAVVGDQCMARPALALILKAKTMFQSRSLDNLDATSNALIIEAHSQLRGRKNLIQYNLEATDAYVDQTMRLLWRSKTHNNISNCRLRTSKGHHITAGEEFKVLTNVLFSGKVAHKLTGWL